MRATTVLMATGGFRPAAAMKPGQNCWQRFIGMTDKLWGIADAPRSNWLQSALCILPASSVQLVADNEVWQLFTAQPGASRMTAEISQRPHDRF